ncbi:Tn3 family transposase [Mesorhizobium sp. LNJC394B00]|uniref:Tn3 family transposase n=1 Tax=Mesorhizobium sp. LNJC394B00 TaxID=1287274 RepID=UPI002472F085|nr:Tn3 family transposase [Mesorhizobium sp. LNJC394B00]
MARTLSSQARRPRRHRAWEFIPWCELRDRTFERQFHRASGLNLLINVIVYWNTLYLEPAFADLNRNGIATPP